MAFLNHYVHEQKTLTSNQTATLTVPTGGKIQDLTLRFATGAGADATEAAIRSEIGNIRLTVNGEDVVNVPAYKLYDLYEFLGTNVGASLGLAGAIELNIGRLVFADPMMRDVFGFGTKDVANIQVQVTAGTLSTIASVQSFTGREAGDFNRGAYAKFINYPISFNATGVSTVDTLPRDIDTSYLAVMVEDGASGTITAGECRVNQQVVLDSAYPASVNNANISNQGFTTPAGYFVYSFMDRLLTGRLVMQDVTDFRLNTTFSVAPGAAGYACTALTLKNVPKK